jgi:hypothetical protein
MIIVFQEEIDYFLEVAFQIPSGDSLWGKI